MIIELDMSSSTPIYVQLRNQIVKGIGKGELKTGEKLPTVRQLASDAGVNTMTVNKAYQILKNEGFIRTDRRLGAFVSESIADDTDFTEKLESAIIHPFFFKQKTAYEIHHRDWSSDVCSSDLSGSLSPYGGLDWI